VNQTVTGEWIWRNALPQGNGLNDVVWNGSLLVAVGYAGTILTSTDGAQWTERTSGTELPIEAAIWTGSQFVAVGGTYTQTGLVLTSPDGINWTVHETDISNSFYDVTWSGERLVAVGEDGLTASSSDGVNWTQHTHSGTTLFLWRHMDW
jgi:hypothetical protein